MLIIIVINSFHSNMHHIGFKRALKSFQQDAGVNCDTYTI